MNQQTPKNNDSLAAKTSQYFEFLRIDSSGRKQYQCTLCKKVRVGNQPSNLTSHLKKMHEDIYSTEIKTHEVGDDIELRMKRLKLLQYCVEITTINKEPFSVLLKSGVQKLIANKVKKLNKAGIGIDLTNKNLRHVHT